MQCFDLWDAVHLIFRASSHIYDQICFPLTVNEFVAFFYWPTDYLSVFFITIICIGYCVHLFSGSKSNTVTLEWCPSFILVPLSGEVARNWRTTPKCKYATDGRASWNNNVHLFVGMFGRRTLSLICVKLVHAHYCTDKPACLLSHVPHCTFISDSW